MSIPYQYNKINKVNFTGTFLNNLSDESVDVIARFMDLMTTLIFYKRIREIAGIDIGEILREITWVTCFIFNFMKYMIYEMFSCP